MVNHDTMPDPIGANYAVWPKDTVIQLHNVPWNNDFRDIVNWKSEGTRENWFNSRPVGSYKEFLSASTARISEPIRLQIPFDEAYRYNYIRVKNPGLPANGTKATAYYYFILGIDQRAPGTTYVTVQLDVWTTFGMQATIGQAYVERGHVGVANENNFNNFGRDFLTIPEGFDVGAEYQTVHHVNKRVMWINQDLSDDTSGYSQTPWIVIASTVNLEVGLGDIKNPNLASAHGDSVNGLPSGAAYYWFDSVASFRSFMASIADKPWASQGIISITMVPDPTKYGYAVSQVKPPWLSTASRMYTIKSDQSAGQRITMMPNWRDSSTILRNIPEKYRRFKKFLTAPYMMLELTTFQGSPVVMRPESWNEPNAVINENAVLVAPNQKIVYRPIKYNAGRGSTNIERDNNGGFLDDNGEYWDLHTAITSMPTFALVNSGYLAFMASNAHGIAQQYQSADWSQQRATYGAQVSYDQANNAIAVGADNARISRNLDIAGVNTQNSYRTMQGIIGAAQGLTGGALSGAAGGPATAIAGAGIGAAANAAGNMLDQMQSGDQLRNRNAAAVESQRNTQGGQQFLADTNKQLANFAARGDYMNSVNALNARVQDARLTQPSVSGQAGGEVLNLMHGGLMVSLRFKMLSYNAMQVIGDFWLRYGYAVNRFLNVDRLQVMSRFSYWKMSEVYLVNTYLPEFIKQAIRGIFEKGVTVWQNPEEIGVIDISQNAPLAGIVIPVEPDPVPVEPDPDPLIPIVDFEDKMYLAHTVGINGNDEYWAISRKYLNLLNVTGSTRAAMSKITGETFTDLARDEFSAVLKGFGIPSIYSSTETFRADQPDGVWSDDEPQTVLLNSAVQERADNYTALNNGITAILQVLQNPDNPGAE